MTSTGFADVAIRAGMNVARARFLKKRYVALAAILLFLLLLTSTTPATPVPPLPNAEQVRDARALAERISAHGGSQSGARGGGPVSASWKEIEGASLLLARASHVEHLSVKRGVKALDVTLSLPIGLGLWINAEGHVPESNAGFPAVYGKVGALPVPSFLARGILGLGRVILGWRGIDMPPLDDMVQSARFTADGATGMIRIPKDAKLLRALAQGSVSDINSDEVIARYCGLMLTQQDHPDPDFLTQVHRAFTSRSPVSDYAASNRAALLALAMFTVSPDVGKIAGIPAERVRGCAGLKMDLLLIGRSDLPKHWTLSAALTAVLGSDLSQAMGVWKEVADSGPDGSGFSFVDLSADRSGINFGRRAVSGDTAEATAGLMRTIKSEQLLPIRALALQEGMNDAQFAQRFTQVDSAKYNAMVARIDRLLAGAN